MASISKWLEQLIASEDARGECIDLLAEGQHAEAIALAGETAEPVIWPAMIMAFASRAQDRPMRALTHATMGLQVQPGGKRDRADQQTLKEFYQELTAEVESYENVDCRAQVTACVIAKNEAKHIAACLTSVAPVCSRLVVVDTGSTDDTIQIAKAHGAEVGQIEWKDDFSAARNAALEMAQTPWVLSIDADERLANESVGAVRVGVHDPSVAYSPLIDTVGGGRSFAMPRLFPREGAAWQYMLHEQIVYESADVITMQFPPFVILHERAPESVAIEKRKRNRRILARMLSVQPQLASVYMALEDAAEAPGTPQTIDSLKAALDATSLWGPALTRKVLMSLVTNLIKANRVDEAEAFADLAEQLGLHGLWSYHMKARAAMMRGDRWNARKYAQIGLNIPEMDGPVDQMRRDLTHIMSVTR